MKFLQKDVEKPCCFRCSKTTSDLQVAALAFLLVGPNPKLDFHNVLFPCYPCAVEKQNNSEVVKKITMGPACLPPTAGLSHPCSGWKLLAQGQEACQRQHENHSVSSPSPGLHRCTATQRRHTMFSRLKAVLFLI